MSDDDAIYQAAAALGISRAEWDELMARQAAKQREKYERVARQHAAAAATRKRPLIDRATPLSERQRPGGCRNLGEPR